MLQRPRAGAASDMRRQVGEGVALRHFGQADEHELLLRGRRRNRRCGSSGRAGCRHRAGSRAPAFRRGRAARSSASVEDFAVAHRQLPQRRHAVLAAGPAQLRRAVVQLGRELDAGRSDRLRIDVQGVDRLGVAVGAAAQLARRWLTKSGIDGVDSPTPESRSARRGGGCGGCRESSARASRSSDGCSAPSTRSSTGSARRSC